MEPEADLNELERTLEALAPRASRLDREQLMYRAGQASVSPRRAWIWPASTAALTVTAVVLGLALLLRPVDEPLRDTVSPHADERADHIAGKAEPASSDARGALTEVDPLPSKETRLPANYLRVRRLALAQGVDALPIARVSGGQAGRPAPTSRMMIEALLGDERESGSL